MSINSLAKEGFTPQKIAQMIDLSAVRTENDDQSIQKRVECAHCYQVGLVTTLPAQTSLARKLLGQLKVILECHFLSLDQIRKGCDLAGKMQNL